MGHQEKHQLYVMWNKSHDFNKRNHLPICAAWECAGELSAEPGMAPGSKETPGNVSLMHFRLGSSG